MKKLTLAALLATTTFAMSASAAEINYAYGLYGAQEMAPLQVFDDGRQLFMQLQPRRQSAPPVPFTEDGVPIQYELRGPYMVMDMKDRVVLRVGGSRLYIQSARDAENGRNRSPNGILGVNVWHGAAVPVSVTSSAPKPVPATSVMAESRLAVIAKSAEVRPPSEPVSVPKTARVLSVADYKAKAGIGAVDPIVESKAGIGAVGPIVESSEKAVGGRMSGAFSRHMTGSFTTDGVSGEKTNPAEFLVSIGDKPAPEVIEAMVTWKKVRIEADGTAAGYRKAVAFKASAKGATTVSIRAIGAPVGHLRIQSGV